MYAIDHDNSEIRNKVSKNLAFLHTNLERKLDLEHNSVNRLYKRISSSSYSSKQAILADFKAYKDDYPSIYFIYYLDPEPIFSSRYDIDEGQALSILKNCNLQNKSNLTLVCFQKQNDKFNVVFKPNFSKEVIDDFNSDNYNLEIFLEGKKIYSNLSPNDTYSLAISESFSGAKYWKITAYFTTTDYEKLQRSFPLVFFILGILISIMAHVFFHLLNINSRKNKILNLNERKLKKLNSIDPLTNSLNRNSLMNELEVILKDNRLTNSQTAVLFIDLDNFKYINDNYGHNTGDKILVETVNRLHLNLRLNDLIARSGGDEFVIVLKNINSKDEIIKILERIFASFAEKIYLRDDLIITQSLSIGISIIDQNNDLSADDIIKQADDAMYIAKRRGKNQYHFFK
jgi:diguanylate cyclase (GGDEF)-like protein